MKQLAMLLLFTAITAVSTQAQQAKEWTLDKAHTSVNFEVTHFFNTVNGTFTDYQGNFYFDPDNLQGSKFTFTIPVSSIDTNNDKRDEHLRSEDFFNASKYPNIKFESTSFEKKTDKKYVVYGDMTMRDVTKRISVPFEITGKMDHPMKENTELVGLSFDTTLDRTDFNVGTGNWASDQVVGDEVDVTINLELNRKK